MAQQGFVHRLELFNPLETTSLHDPKHTPNDKSFVMSHFSVMRAAAGRG